MIRVLIVDDSKIVYQGLKVLLASDAQVETVGFANNGHEAIEQIPKHEPDIVLVDILMPVVDGIETTKEISRLFPEVKVIVLSSFEDNKLVLKAIAAGAQGYLLKNTTAQDLILAIHSVYRGCAYFTPGIIGGLAQNALALLSSKSTGITNAPNQEIPVTTTKQLKLKSRRPLFEYGDWLSIVLGVIILSQTMGMSHYVEHTALFLLMLALVARPICVWWDWPFKHRRLIGLGAFILSVVHTFHKLAHSLNWNPDAIAFMIPQHRVGIVAGILSLCFLFPAAITSFQYFKRTLGNKWRKIHLLTVPALTFAILHAVLIGSHYMATFEIEAINHVRTWAVISAGSLVLLLRSNIIQSILRLNSASKKA